MDDMVMIYVEAVQFSSVQLVGPNKQKETAGGCGVRFAPFLLDFIELFAHQVLAATHTDLSLM